MKTLYTIRLEAQFSTPYEEVVFIGISKSVLGAWRQAIQKFYSVYNNRCLFSIWLWATIERNNVLLISDICTPVGNLIHFANRRKDN